MNIESWVTVGGFAFAMASSLIGVWFKLNSRIDDADRQIAALKSDVRVAGVEREALKSGHKEQLDAIRDTLDELKRDLKEHMKDEPEQLRRVLREVLTERGAP